MNPMGHPVEDAAQQLHLVSLLTAGGDGTLPWATAVELVLYEVGVDVDACRHAVDDASNGWAVTLAKRGQRE